jgi:hypothetical protein
MIYFFKFNYILFMFTAIFAAILRCVAVPVVAFLALQPIVGDKAAFLVVTIALTVTNILSIIWQVLKILPNMVFLRGWKIFKSIVTIFIELASIIGFWLYYLANYN